MDSIIRIIDGKRYNTKKAELLAVIENDESEGDLDWEKTGIYRTPKGAFFLAGEGGARTRWARGVGHGGMGGGGGVQPLTPAEALEHLEGANAMEAIEKYFGNGIKDA